MNTSTISDTVELADGRRTLQVEEMRNKPNVWDLPEYKDTPLRKLLEQYKHWCANRPRPIAQGTIDRYRFDIESFLESLEYHEEPLVLDSVCPHLVDQWIGDMRKGLVGLKRVPLSEVTISTRVGSLKIFTRKYIFKYAELTTRDLLAKVELPTAPERTKQGYSDAELQRLLDVYEDSDDYTEIRDRAMLYLYASTALRFSELRDLREGELDPVTGDIFTIQKGDFERAAKASERALKVLRKYLRIRRAAEGVKEIFTTWDGKPISYSGGQMIFRRLKDATGIEWAHAHRFRHTWAQRALDKGAERQLVQDAMGWRSDRMARRYQGSSRQRTAAARMPELSPI